MRDLAVFGGLIFLSCFGAIVGTCIVLLVAERQETRRGRKGLK